MLTLKEACDFLGCDPRTIRRLMRDPAWPVRFTAGATGVAYQIDADDLAKLKASEPERQAAEREAKQRWLRNLRAKFLATGPDKGT